MRRAALVALAGLAVLVLGVRASASEVLTPTSVDAGTSVEFVVDPGPSATISDVTLTLPPGFQVWGCPSSETFTCHGITTDESQPTTLEWTRNEGTAGTPQGGRFACQVNVHAAGGTYTFEIVTNDSVNGARTYEPTVQVKGNATTTTSTTRPTTTTTTKAPASTTTSSTIATTTTEPDTTTSTSTATVTTTRRSGTNAGGGDGDTNNALPLAVGVVTLGAASVGTALAWRRMRGGAVPPQ